MVDSKGAKEAGLLSDHFQLIPSFFALIKALNESGRSYSLTLRGFGSEVALGGAELTAFLERRHPVYSEGDGTQISSGNKTIEHKGIREGIFQRDSMGCSLVMGGGVSKPLVCRGERATEPDAIVAAMLPKQIKQETGKCAILKDCQSWWERKQEPSAGKFFPLRRRETEVHALFFDTQARKQVDTRDDQGDHVPYAEVAGVHVIEVDPLRAMSDEAYFTELLAGAEARYAEDLGERAPSMTFGLTEVF